MGCWFGWLPHDAARDHQSVVAGVDERQRADCDDGGGSEAEDAGVRESWRKRSEKGHAEGVATGDGGGGCC